MAASGGCGDAVKEVDYDSLFEINPEFMKKDFIDKVRNTLNGNAADSLPFPHISMDNFLTNSVALDLLTEELHKSKWNLKINDLYTRKCTTELINFDITVFPALKNFRRFLATIGREFMMKVTGVELNDRIAITGSCYEHTHVLLPHDDRMEERKFAFIFYLTPGWKEEWGGALNLYNADERHYPTDVAKKIIPKNNSFLFFDINYQEGHTSWHHVQEVLEAGKERLSLNGWFHVDNVGPIRILPPEAPIVKIPPSLMVDYEDVRAWINPTYIAQSEQKQIKKLFAEKSELVLPSFFTKEKYTEALRELKAAEFTRLGPVNRRAVDRLDESKLPENSALKQLFNLMRSDAMSLLITQWTGIHFYDLRALEADAPPNKKVKAENPPAEKPKKDVQIVSYLDRYSHGSYSLVDDRMAADSHNDGFCFDLLMFFSETESWNNESGGHVTYFAVNDKDELLRVEPEANRVAFVFREPEVLNFIKYINSKAGNDTFYLLNCSYYSNTSGDSESESSTDEFEDVDSEEFDSEQSPDEFGGYVEVIEDDTTGDAESNQ